MRENNFCFQKKKSDVGFIYYARVERTSRRLDSEKGSVKMSL